MATCGGVNVVVLTRDPRASCLAQTPNRLDHTMQVNGLRQMRSYIVAYRMVYTYCKTANAALHPALQIRISSSSDTGGMPVSKLREASAQDSSNGQPTALSGTVAVRKA